MYFLQGLSLLTNDAHFRKKMRVNEQLYRDYHRGIFGVVSYPSHFFWPLTHLPLSPLGERSWVTGEKGSTAVLHDTALC